MKEIPDFLTPLGFGAVLEFAYYGHVALGHLEEGETGGVLNACEYLQMDRLRKGLTHRVTTSASKEKDKSLALIKDMWDKGLGCDIIIQADTGERYSGKMIHLPGIRCVRLPDIFPNIPFPERLIHLLTSAVVHPGCQKKVVSDINTCLSYF